MVAEAACTHCSVQHEIENLYILLVNLDGMDSHIMLA